MKCWAEIKLSWTKPTICLWFDAWHDFTSCLYTTCIFFNMHYEIPGVTGYVCVIDWTKIKCNRSAGHTIVVIIRSLIKLLKMRGSCNDIHPACGLQMIHIVKYLFSHSLKMGTIKIWKWKIFKCLNIGIIQLHSI